MSAAMLAAEVVPSHAQGGFAGRGLQRVRARKEIHVRTPTMRIVEARAEDVLVRRKAARREKEKEAALHPGRPGSARSTSRGSAAEAASAT